VRRIAPVARFRQQAKAWHWRSRCEAIGEATAEQLLRQWHVPGSTLNMERCRLARCELQPSETGKVCMSSVCEASATNAHVTVERSICRRVSANSFLLGGGILKKNPMVGVFSQANDMATGRGSPQRASGDSPQLLSFGAKTNVTRYNSRKHISYAGCLRCCIVLRRGCRAES
jgi:hypothetical protein